MTCVKGERPVLMSDAGPRGRRSSTMGTAAAERTWQGQNEGCCGRAGCAIVPVATATLPCCQRRRSLACRCQAAQQRLDVLQLQGQPLQR